MPRIIGLILLFAVAIGAGLWVATLTAPEQPQRSVSGGAHGLGGDFTLMGHRGPVSLSDFRGKAVVLAYGYTSCPDICPMTLQIFATALKQLTPEELTQVQPLFVTIDPERDTPARVAEYAQHFHPQIIGLSGTPEQIAAVAKQYLVIYRKVALEDSALGYAMDHSSRVYLLDQDGHYVDSSNHLARPQELAQQIRAILKG